VKRTVFLLCSILLAAPAFSRADDEENESPVDLLMGQVSRDLKKLSRQAGNKNSQASSLELIDAMIKANAEAAELTPESVGNRAGEEREKYLARYSDGMAELGGCLAKLKVALESNDAAQAEALIEEAYDLRKKYHTELDVN
jgi:soluble cytochrome b562